MSLWYEDELGWNYCTFCDVWELSLSEDESESEEQHIWRCQKISSKETVSRKYNRKTIFFIISKDKVRNYFAVQKAPGLDTSKYVDSKGNNKSWFRTQSSNKKYLTFTDEKVTLAKTCVLPHTLFPSSLLLAHGGQGYLCLAWRNGAHCFNKSNYP